VLHRADDAAGLRTVRVVEGLHIGLVVVLHTGQAEVLHTADEVAVLRTAVVVEEPHTVVVVEELRTAD
jgi:hypothetical protein